MHTVRAIVGIPQLREDEIAYSPAITKRRLLYSIDGNDPVTVDLELQQASFTIPGIPNSATILLSLSNVDATGREGEASTRSVQAPNPIPVPEAVSVVFEDEEHNE